MRLSQVFSEIVLLAASYIARYSSSNIRWQSCDATQFNTSVDIDCSTVLVPLDYTAPNSSEKLNLQLISAQAIMQPSKGTILFNFGGTGEPGRDIFAVLAPVLLP
jgi:hypothetical protein